MQAIHHALHVPLEVGLFQHVHVGRLTYLTRKSIKSSAHLQFFAHRYGKERLNKADGEESMLSSVQIGDIDSLSRESASMQ